MVDPRVEDDKPHAVMAEGMQVALGGTFDPVHDGHRTLFDRAFQLGDVTVGLTSDDFAPQTRNEERYVRPFDERKRDLDRELERVADHHDREFEIRELDERTGIATEPGFEYLIVSPENKTKEGAKEINRIRQEQELEPLEIVVVDHVEAEDGDRISSTRIVQGEIDEHGNLTPEREGRPQIREREQ
jgi:pantetheine-phosphate adenylyltransferase